MRTLNKKIIHCKVGKVFGSFLDPSWRCIGLSEHPLQCGRQEHTMAVCMQKASFSVYKSLETTLTVLYGWIVGVHKLAFDKLNRQ